MQYVITFLEGLISFISPCMLPMLPVYVSYFAGDIPEDGGDKRRGIFPRALAFVIGFTLVFSLLGLFAGSLGSLLTRYQTAVNIVCGAIVILFGLSYLGVIRIPMFRGMQAGRSAGSLLSAFVFGVIYSVSLTPCVGAFLGSALMMASASGTALRGVMLLISYSLGLGVPFILSAMLIEQLGETFAFIKKHYRIIDPICGIFLIVVGVLMACGLMNALMSVFS